MTYHLYTDGACSPNPGKGGWSFILRSNMKDEVVHTGYDCDTTNNRMELLAVLKGIDHYKSHMENGKLLVYSDSQYLVNGINEWMEGWKNRNWKRRGDKPVKNDDLWKKIYTLCQGLNVICIHVKGHTGHVENERCDKLAVNTIKQFKDSGVSIGEIVDVR